MRWFWRDRLPAEIRSSLELRRGERVLAHAPADEGLLVATTQALHLPTEAGHDRVPWERIDQARWEESGLTFAESGAGVRSFAVSEPGLLPEVLQERVTATIAASEHIVLPAGGDAALGVRLAARRAPGADAATVTWQARFDPGLDPSDPETRHQAELALAELREQTGL